MMRTVIGTMAALAVGGAVAMFAAARAAEEPPLAEVVRNLGNADFAVREAAQKRLREMPPELHDTLRDLAEREKDAEVRQRLLTRVDEIELIWATDPPPISLHIHNVNDYGMAEALAKSLGEPLSLQQEQQGALYTLDAEKKPFWEVYRALMLQHPVMLQTSYWSNDLLARIAQRGDAVQIERHGGITVIAAAAPPEEREFNGSHKPQPPVPEGLRKVSLLLAYVTDPRIDVLKYWTPLISSVTDEKGNALLKRDAGGDGTTPNGGEKFWREAIDLNLPKEGGTRTVSVKGEVHVLVGVKSAKYEFADLAHRVGGNLQVGEERYMVKKFEAADKPRDGGMFDVMLDIVREGEAEREPPRCQILDANGRIVGDQVYDGVNVNRIGASCVPKPVGPFKLVMVQAEKTKDWRIPFELKGVVVP